MASFYSFRCHDSTTDMQAPDEYAATRLYVRPSAYGISTNTEVFGLSQQPTALTYDQGFEQLFDIQQPSCKIQLEVTWDDVVSSVFAQIDDERERLAELEASRALVQLPLYLGIAVCNRFRKLIAVAQEEGLETAGPSPGAIRAAVAFMVSIGSDVSLRVPNITLDSNGLVVCEWRDTPSGDSAVLRFTSDGTVGCVLTVQAPGRAGRTNTWYGAVSMQETRRSMLDNESIRSLISG